MELNVQKYLLADRQWPRQHRISHARAKLAKAETKHEKQFWRSILEANMGD